MPQCVTLSFFRFSGVPAKVWAFGMMGYARLMMPKVPDIGFWKLCGSGVGEGFTPIPNTAVYAILATWPGISTAKARVASDPVYKLYSRKSVENYTVFLTPTSARGNWAGVEPFRPKPGDTPTDGPLAALTRATVKPVNVAKFWGRVPNISQVIGQDPNVAFKIGIGEVPWLHQVTFSIWPDAQSMADFARKPGGPHAQAIKAVRDEHWFKEELYARFTVSGDTGTWEGKSPLAHLKEAA